jgi:4-hydroxybenzoate polyprenyltransferase
MDVEADRIHPTKRLRPIASKKVSYKEAYFLMGGCFVASMTILPLTHSSNILLLYLLTTCYWLMNIAYCLKLKQYAILDVSIIAFGFVLRIFIGGFTTDIWISQWLILMTFLIAIFLALTKRSDDYSIYEHTGTKPRVSITGYNISFINQATSIVASVNLVCYIMYTMSEEVISRMGTNYLYLTSIWALLGYLRYLQNMIVYNNSNSPTKAVTSDRFIQICLLGWILSFILILYW